MALLPLIHTRFAPFLHHVPHIKVSRLWFTYSTQIQTILQERQFVATPE